MQKVHGNPDLHTIIIGRLLLLCNEDDENTATALYRPTELSGRR